MPTNITVAGFYDGNGDYKVRFAPPYEGTWSYTTTSNIAALDGKTGQLDVTPPSNDNHGLLWHLYASGEVHCI